MRRGSVVFPFILIVLGGLFLANNLNPSLSVIGLVSRFWPMLLIVWGALRAGEILFTYLQGRPLPMAGVSGGEWFLAVFLSFIGLGMMGYQRFAPVFPGRFAMRGMEIFGEPFDYPLQGKASAVGATKLVIENLRGNARVVTGDVTEVQVSGRTTVRAISDSEARRTFDKMPFEVIAQGGQVLVRTNQERATGDGRVSADLDITIPKTMGVEARGRYGDFDITGTSGNIAIFSDNAGVRLQEIGGNVTIDLRRSDVVRAVNVKGTVEIRGRGDDLELENIDGQVTIVASYSGDINFRNLAKPARYESSNSNISFERLPGFLRLARGELVGAKIVGPIRITSKTKDIRLSDYTNTVEIDVDRGDVELRPGKAPIFKTDVRTRNGDIELALPEGAKMDLTATTQRGETMIDYPGLRTNREGQGGTIKSITNQGPAVQMETKRGGLTVRVATGSDAGEWVDAPAPPKVSNAPAAPGAPKPPAPTVPLKVQQQ
ncbi:MAG: DUF4097 family beta strand repeat-containing protein [Acidobacteria bacterium]|nr:DUF4097 family beta strand repeat-containing protein [Acidobacteriota bacterium]